MSGQKILDGLKDAVAGNFARVTIEGQVWVRQERAPVDVNSKEAELWSENMRLKSENEHLRAALKYYATATAADFANDNGFNATAALAE